ncbi:hypothetical protein TorRG33x02_115230, partial [Trema orientale]
MAIVSCLPPPLNFALPSLPCRFVVLIVISMFTCSAGHCRAPLNTTTTYIPLLLLTRAVVEDYSVDYYCDICESESDPRICVLLLSRLESADISPMYIVCFQ